MPLARHCSPQREPPIPQHVGDVSARHKPGRIERDAVLFPVNDPRHAIRLAAALIRVGLVQDFFHCGSTSRRPRLFIFASR